MAQDAYFGELGLQLVQPPRSSLEVLAAVAKGRTAPAAPPSASFPITQARGWAKNLLNAPFAPGPDVLFLAFPREAERFDVVRAAYRVGDYQVEIAESVHVLSVRLRGRGLDTGGAVERASAAARLALKAPDILFRAQGTLGAGEWGTREGVHEGEWPRWDEQLRFWTDGGDVGFITLKGSGKPTSALITPDDEANIHWFE